MASRRSTYEIAGLVFVTIILIVLLVLVSITFTKVNNPPSSATEGTKGTEGTATPPTRTTESPKDVHYAGIMDTQQQWDPRLKDPEDSFYNSTVDDYVAFITEALKTNYTDAVTTVNGFDEQPVPTVQLGRKVNGKAEADGTVNVLFTTVIPNDKGDIITPDDVQKTINENINKTDCDGCEVTHIDVITSTAGTTSTPRVPTTTTSRRINPLTPDEIAAEYIKSNLDRRYDPCEDFYSFACGNFANNHSIKQGAVGYGTFDLVQDRVGDIILKNLRKINVTDPDIHDWQAKTKRFYDSCKEKNQTGIDHNKQLLKYIEELGGWPMIMENGTWNEKKFNLAEVVANLTSKFSVQTLVSADVDLDWSKPDRYLLQLDQSTLALGNAEFYTHPKFEKDRRDYLEMIRQSAAILTFDQDMPQNDERVRLAADEILNFEILLANHIVSEDDRQDYTHMYNPESINDIQESYGFMDWTTYFKRLLPKVVTDKGYQGPANIVEKRYLRFLNRNVKLKSKEQLANYLVWRLVFSLNNFIDDNVQHMVSRFRATSRIGVTDLISDRDDQCVTLIINNIGFAASRLLIDGTLIENELNNIAVKNMTNGLRESFKAQLDTLFWMDDATRKIAKDKLDDYVENDGFPTWIEDSDTLDKYYKDLSQFPDRFRFLNNYVDLLTFHEETRFRVLVDPKVRRDTWIMAPAIVNAWYQPDFNSITFPSGILRPPFFKHDFPKYINYGSLGTVIGHEITHGFDDQGVQFNGTGYLEMWMSAQSRLGFKRMVECVIRQYDHTCFTQVDMCIDGTQTQGENTADNGGIRESYNAYRKYVLENGEEPRLKGLEEFSPDQMFFLSFANVWCGDYETKEYLENQLVTNVHSPPPARVKNTLKNFDQFGKVWRCEVGQTYYPFPSEACDVWDSPLVSNNTEYIHTADRLLASMKDTIGPCEDFFEHACGNYIFSRNIPENGSSVLSIDILQRDIFDKIIGKFYNVTETAPMALQNAKTYFETCKHASNNERINNTEVLDVITNTLGGWPALGGAKLPYTAANAKSYLSDQVGKLANMFGIQTLVVASPTVDPGDTSRTILALDQSSLALGAREYYLESKLKNVTVAYYDLIFNVLLILSESQGSKLSFQDATSYAQQITAFETKLAKLTRPDKDRKNFTLLYNLYNDGYAKTNFTVLDLTAYLNALVSPNENLTKYFANPNASIVISERSFFDLLGDLITEENREDNTTVQNYLVWRFTYSRLQFMDAELKQLYTDFQLLKQDVNELPPAETDCVSQLATMLGYTVGRLYIEDWKKNGDSWRSDASKMITNITEAFDETIPELDWMDIRSQQGAKTKVNNLFKNTGYPDWILDDKILDDYYAEYKIDENSSYFDVFNQLNQYAMIKAFEAILVPVDRHDFQMSPAIVNAWYNPSLNSLTVPAAFLNPPFYHPEYPTAVKYGAIGAVMGHELTHAFDDSGIQFDGDGLLDLWMTEYSRDSYDTNVVDCVINEYNHYCHFDGEYCVDGERTQGENIADNGGIRQAFRAYRNHIREEIKRDGHEDELLPRMEWYTNDQLFFYSYAQLWCGYYSDQSVRRQLLTDVHSPGMDRVKGVVQNSVDFAKAFHCEVNTPMNPEDKCYVWADPVDTTEGYDKAAKGLLESLDPSTEPCDDFYQYACGGWINRHPIPKDASTISTNSLTANAVVIATADSISNINVNDKTIPDAFLKTKQMYDFCRKDLNDIHSTSLDSFQQYVNGQLGQWPIITKFWMPKTTSTPQQVFGVAGRLGKLGLSTLLTAYPQPDFKNDTTGKKQRHYALYVDQASLLLGNRELYINDMFADVIMKYKDVLVLTAVKFANQFANADVPIQNIISDVDDIIKFETNLARLSLPDALLENYTLQYNKRNMTELKTEYPNIDFETFFKELLPAEVLDQDKPFDIILSEPTFLAGLNNILPYIDARTIQNYLIWRYVIDSASLLGSDMKAILRDLKRKTDFVEELPSDVATCTQDVIALLPYAAGRLYVEKAFGSEKNRLDIEEKAKKLIVEIVEQFNRTLTSENLLWLDVNSTAIAQEKLTELIKNVGYPEWTFNNTELDEVYSLTISTTQDYYTTKREVSEWFYQQRFGVLEQTTLVRRENFQSSPATQNAWYQPWLNSLTIPAGEIQIPFYATDYPSAVNFGGMGAIVGHELTHGFDDDGVQFGPDGELDYWITPESASYFKENISQCIIDQYDQYCYPDLKNPGEQMCINGKVTQGENIADNGGTKTAFNAYVEWVSHNGYEALLPGMESFTMNQIFFLNFARSWCGSIKPEALEKQLLLDVHSPARDRVIGTLSNMKAFHDAFSCKVGDNMYPEHTCDVW